MNRVNLHPVAVLQYSQATGLRKCEPSAPASIPGLRWLSCLLMAAALLMAASARAAGDQPLSGHVPSAIAKLDLKPIGDLSADKPLKLAFSLPLRDAAGLDRFINQLYDPKSPGYRNFIKPDEFTSRFGPTVAAYESVKQFAVAHGITVSGTTPNRLLLDVEMTPAEIERVFHVKMKLYQHPTEHRTFYAPDGEPMVDAALPISHIFGLDNYDLPKPHLAKVRPLGQPLAGAKPNLGSGPQGTYGGLDFPDAYAPNVKFNGAGQSVALLELDGYFADDIATYAALFNLRNVPVVNFNIDGFNGQPITLDGDVECSLDIEMALSMAQGLSTIYVYEASEFDQNGPIDVLNRMATDNLAKQMSSSWGWSDAPAYDVVYKEFAAQGQSYFQACGDSGSFNISSTNTAHDDDPYVTLVGGTTLSTTGPQGAYVGETVWNWNTEFGDSGGQGTNAAGGGGFDTNYSLPSYQVGLNLTNSGGSTNYRNCPDVAMTADNVFVVADEGGGLSVGGTSAAAPLWAGFMSRVSQKAQLTDTPYLGFLNPTLYALGQSSNYPVIFHDITKGNNTNASDPTNFFAVPGYDLCTGWGTPPGEAMIDALVPSTVQISILDVLTNYVSGGNGDGMIDPNDCVNLTVALTNEGTVGGTQIRASLTSLTPGIFVGQSVVAYPDIAPGSVASNLTPFTVSAQPNFVCGTPVILQLVAQAGLTSTTNFIQIATGTLGPALEYDNNLATPVVTQTNSIINVSGVGVVGKVAVSLFMPTIEDEFLTLELTSPDGTVATLASADGGVTSDFGNACSPQSQRTTFVDDATQSITNTAAAPFVGEFSPLTPLSVFNFKTGSSVNGPWTLTAINGATGNTTIIDCWSLFISSEQCSTGSGTCPGADLSITISNFPVSISQGNVASFTLVAANNGPSDATNVEILQTLPPGLQYLSSTQSAGSVAQSGTGLSFTLANLPAGSNVLIQEQIVGAIPGLFTSQATISSPSPDGDTLNNTASTSLLVTKPATDLGVSMSVFPASLPVNGRATFTMSVTNNGPEQANGVTLTNFLPANATVVSATTTVGTITPSGTLASIGTLNQGSGAVVTLVLSPTALGTMTLTSDVGESTNEFDPFPGNNSATATVVVAPAADLGISLVVSPSPTIEGADYTNIITVTNGGPNTATTVVMKETLPPNATYISSSQGSATEAGGVVTWNINTMLPGTSQVLTNILQAPTLIQGLLSNVLVTSATVGGQPSDPNTANNMVAVSTINLPPIELIEPGTISVQAPAVVVSPGVPVVVQLGLVNIGNIPTTNLVATLQTNAGVTPSTSLQYGPQNYGALAPGGGTGTGTFSFTANAPSGGTVTAVLQLQDGTNNLGTASFVFVMPNVTTFWNTNIIHIPATNYLIAPFNAAGPGGPYPSSNFVSGVTSYVANVTVTLSNLYHTFPSDIELLLVGPGGQSSILMSDAAQFSTMEAPITLTFDQTAPLAITNNESLSVGSYQPGQFNSPVFTNVSGVSPMPPAGPYTANLSVFSANSPNGWWYLYAYDSTQGDYGAISNGWALSFHTLVPVNPVTHVGAGIAALPSQLFVSSNVTFTVSVTNFGTNATTVYLTNTLSSGLSFVSSSPISPASTSGSSQYFNLGNLGVQTNLTLTITAVATVAGPQNDSAGITSSVSDPNALGHQVMAEVTASLPAATLAAGISAISGQNTVGQGASVLIGTNVVYTLSITNLGPNTALNAGGSLTQSTTNGSGVVFSNYFGTLAAGSSGSVSFTNAPMLPGFLTNTWKLSTASSDTNSAAATAVLPAIMVVPPEPNIVASGVRLISESIQPPNGTIDSNETVTVAFTLSNVGLASTTNLTATLAATNGVTPITTSQAYGALAPGATGTQSYQFIGRGTPGATLTAVLVLTDGTYSLGAVSNSFVIPSTTRFTNATAISIPAFGAGNPYPSSITVSGLSGIVSNATVTIRGFSHPFPQDVNVLLVSPAGQQTLLMGHVGGAYSVTNLTLTFDPRATQALPNSLLTSGTNLPTEGGTPVLFPGISGPPPANTNLEVFYGSNPDGVWSLYVYADTPGNGGSIASGWSLNLSVISPINPAGLLGVSMSHAPDPVIAGNFLTYTISVTNLSAVPATNVVVSDVLPVSTGLVAAAASQGTVNTNVSGTVGFSFGTLPNLNSVATGTIQVTPQALGVAVNSATAGATLGATNSVNVISLSPFELAAAPSGNSVVLTLTTVPGQTGQYYVIEQSTDLQTWTPLATNTAVGAGQFSITNPVPNSADVFYRALHWPQ